MPWYQVIWDYEAGGNVEHCAEHGVTPEEAEYVLMNPTDIGISRSSDREIRFGRTRAGRSIAVVVEFLDDVTVQPVTAFDVE